MLQRCIAYIAITVLLSITINSGFTLGCEQLKTLPGVVCFRLCKIISTLLFLILCYNKIHYRVTERSRNVVLVTKNI